MISISSFITAIINVLIISILSTFYS